MALLLSRKVHGIIFIVERRGTVPVPRDNTTNKISHENEISSEIQGGVSPPQRTPTLGQIVAYFKYQSTKEMNRIDNTDTVTKFWQRNYYEHILRNDQDLQNKTDYIEANPLRWEQDDENSNR
jgi:hypothetical protein